MGFCFESWPSREANSYVHTTSKPQNEHYSLDIKKDNFLPSFLSDWSKNLNIFIVVFVYMKNTFHVVDSLTCAGRRMQQQTEALVKDLKATYWFS